MGGGLFLMRKKIKDNKNVGNEQKAKSKANGPYSLHQMSNVMNETTTTFIIVKQSEGNRS